MTNQVQKDSDDKAPSKTGKPEGMEMDKQGKQKTNKEEEEQGTNKEKSKSDDKVLSEKLVEDKADEKPTNEDQNKAEGISEPVETEEKSSGHVQLCDSKQQDNRATQEKE